MQLSIGYGPLDSKCGLSIESLVEFHCWLRLELYKGHLSKSILSSEVDKLKWKGSCSGRSPSRVTSKKAVASNGSF